MNKNFRFSSGVLLDIASVEKVSPVTADPSGKTFSIWVTFKGRKETYRYLLGASAKFARLQYSDLLFQLSGQ